jgi:hypothetical protein
VRGEGVALMTKGPLLILSYRTYRVASSSQNLRRHSTLTRASSFCQPQRCSPFLSNYGRQLSRNSYPTQPMMSRPYLVQQPKSDRTCTTSAKRAESSRMALREHSRKLSKMCRPSALLRAWTTWISSYSTCLNWRRSLFGSPLAAPT